MAPSVSDYDVSGSRNVVKSVIVTGGSQGIGLALVRRLAQDGFNVILNDLPSKYEAGQAAAKSISNATGQRVIFMGGDVSKEDDVEALVQRAVEEFGGLDVMVANAGVCTVNSIMDTSLEEWNLNMNVNALGAMFCYRSAARQMIKQGRGGRIIGASTVCAYKGNPTVAAYSASKFAMRGITQAAALEFAPHKITVNCFSGGCINTAMHHDSAQVVSERMQLPKEMLLKGAYSQVPLGYCGEPEDVAGLVSYLASPASHYMTGEFSLLISLLTKAYRCRDWAIGQSISLDGGMQMF
ncbi:Enoyl-(Acyl carrier protein) reductase [Ceratobasidium sp. AG-Ba]|nr:Enoyl-(Acyl carrier protein) reductase [Ceratobasidium sp. AG-Ba]